MRKNTEYRNRYEFTKSTYSYALEKSKYICSECGEKKKRSELEVHHRVAIWFACQNPVLIPDVIRHIANAEVLCLECHQQKHREESFEHYVEEAKILLENWHSFVLFAISGD
jgi:5-methylcytosine-specific restriction endonuclease McrA